MHALCRPPLIAYMHLSWAYILTTHLHHYHHRVRQRFSSKHALFFCFSVRVPLTDREYDVKLIDCVALRADPLSMGGHGFYLSWKFTNQKRVWEKAPIGAFERPRIETQLATLCFRLTKSMHVMLTWRAQRATYTNNIGTKPLTTECTRTKSKRFETFF